jgi:hypothetical protein
VTIDGISEALPPVAETAERSPFGATELWPKSTRRRPVPALKEDGALETDAEESHVLDDLF